MDYRGDSERLADSTRSFQRGPHFAIFGNTTVSSSTLRMPMMLAKMEYGLPARVIRTARCMNAHPLEDGDVPTQRLLDVINTAYMIGVPVSQQNGVELLASRFSHDILICEDRCADEDGQRGFGRAKDPRWV